MSDPRTILIIDDSEDEIYLTQRILARVSPGVKVEAASSGEEGLVRLRNSRSLPLLTLLDLKMTGISGIETLRRIRGDERLKNLLVAIVTNSDMVSDRDEALKAGADAFLHKTYDFDQFSSEIKALLESLLEG
jgi:two-component system response regulator